MKDLAAAKLALGCCCYRRLYGIVLVQVFLYILNYPRDSRLRKITVSVIFKQFMQTRTNAFLYEDILRIVRDFRCCVISFAIGYRSSS